jgi:hypothetical protein
MNDASKHHVRVVNYNIFCEGPAIEIGDYSLLVDSKDEAEKCAAAINARIDAAVAAKSVQLDRVIELCDRAVSGWERSREDVVSAVAEINKIRTQKNRLAPNRYGIDGGETKVITDHDAGDEHR